ncbi:MAG: CRISPR-associated endonuclease Cas2 [Candidatus Paceibacterota bacterium]|jgi:CRISPR-associated endonuclease Cas2
MTIIEKILNEIEKTSLNYKGVRVNLLGIPQFKKYSPNSIKTTLSKMKKDGFIKQNDNNWQVTNLGKKYIKRKAESLLNFESTFAKNEPKNLIVMFDIPEPQKAERDWFRWNLKKFGYIMIQKSVWVGPSPLPKDFLDYLEKIKLEKSVKTFKLAKPYNSKS